MRFEWPQIRQTLVGFLGSLVLRLLNCTLRWERIGLDGREERWPSSDPRIVALWHGRQLLMPWIYLGAAREKRKPFVVLISRHNDGRMIAAGMRFLGIGSVAGSSSQRGLQAMYDLIHTLRSGSHVAITPDGPKGPQCELKQGVIKIAQRTGAFIYPATMSAERRWTFKSWDQMILPKPFSRAVMMMGLPIAVPSELTKEDSAVYANRLEKALNDLTRKADYYWN